MTKVIPGFTMSLDGFFNDRDGSVESLYPDLDTLRYDKPLQDSIKNTGAVVMGRKIYAMGDPDSYAGNYEFQVPIFVITQKAPKKQPKHTDKATFTFVTDGVVIAIRQAKNAAGEKDVTNVGGANIASQCLKAGFVDEIHMDIMPVLLGNALRLFEIIGDKTLTFEITWVFESSINLEKLLVMETSVRTHLKFQVLKEK